MTSFTEDILNRLFNRGDKDEPPARRARAPAEPDDPVVAGPTTCVVIQPLGEDRAAVLAALSDAGMRVREVDIANATYLAQHKPDLVISAFDDLTHISKTIEGLNQASYKGAVQPVGVDHGHIAETFAGLEPGPRFLPPLDRPVVADSLHRVIETEGLARTRGGHVAVRLATALANKWLYFAYQPKISLRTMQLAGAETLARVQHPVHGTLFPLQFLPHSTAQDLRLLGVASIRAGLGLWTPFYRLGFNLLVSVNIPLEAIETNEFIDLVRARRPPDRRWPGLMVEIEAADSVGAIPELKDFTDKVRKFDVLVALDNFGLDATMTTDLSEIGAAEIKLHQNLGQGAGSNPARAAACRAALDLARTYRTTVCATGLENVADVTFFKNLGCDNAQGRTFAEPLDRASFASLLRSRASKKAS